MNRILLVEDDATLSMIVADTLQRNGFEVVNASDGEKGLAAFAKGAIDMIVADVMMPRMGGFEMARLIRQTDRRIPILFLTAKSEIQDVVEGFELGGNDYLKKPFQMLELIVRIKSLLGRITAANNDPLLIGKYCFIPSTQTLRFNSKEWKLSHIDAVLLEKLATNIGQTVEASILMDLIWQRDDPWSRNSLHGFIHKLRRYLRHDPAIAIINQKGIGYMLTLNQPISSV